MSDKLSIMGLPGSHYLARKLAVELGAINCLLPMEVGIYPCGELYLRVKGTERSFFDGREVILVGSLTTNDELLAFYFAAFNLLNKGVEHLSLVIPYCMYGTQEREVEPNEAVPAHAVAHLLSSLPRSDCIRIYMCDLHTSGYRHYFHNGCVPEEIYGAKALHSGISKLGLGDFVVCGGDLGRPKWIKAYAEMFNVKFALVDKTHRGDDTETLGFLGDVAGKEVLIYDDLTHRGRTAVDALELYLNNGAAGGYLVLSHFAVNDGEVIDYLAASRFKKVITTDSHIMSNLLEEHSSNKFVVTSVMPYFADEIRPALARRGVL